MKRIDYKDTLTDYPHLGISAVASGINEIMDYLEHMSKKNGKLFTCINCNHATAFIGDLGKCCERPLYEVSE